MKKYFSFFCYVAMAIAAVSFVSCGDDDEIDDPKKDEPEQVQTVDVYTAAYAADVLEIYDVTLNIYRNGKKQTVALSAANSVKGYNDTYKHDEYYYYCASVNGEEGVDSVVAVVVNKPNIEGIIAGKDASSKSYMSSYAKIKNLYKAANGDYSGSCSLMSNSQIKWGELLEVNELNGVLGYENFRSKHEASFSAK